MASMTWSCPDCGAPSGEACDDRCPSAVAALIEQEAADLEERCCPSPAAAARALCACWGLGPGAWIGSAA